MAPTAAQALKGFTVTGQNKTAVIVGATTGIGAGVAKKLAQCGVKRIITFGRNEKKLGEVIGKMKELAPKDAGLEAEFVTGDLATKSGMNAAAQSLEDALGGTKIDYLVLSQGGTPTGLLDLNEDGNDTPFVTEVLSRFAILHHLVSHSCLAPGAVALVVSNTGQDLPDLSISDLNLKDRLDKKSKIGLFFQQSARNSVVLDSFVEEFHTRYPMYNFYHIWPGLVKGERWSTGIDDFPFPINWIGSLLALFFATTPDTFAPVPSYVLLNRKGPIDLHSARYLGPKLEAKKIGSWAQNEDNRKQLWVKLLELTGRSDA